ncbi:MAG: putative salt-induced outer membrane protein [Granulosicoccus sp.]|jgi:putative salt-induced outer membrane protein
MIRNIDTKNSIAALLVTGTLIFSTTVTAASDDMKDAVSSAFDGWSSTASLGATSSSGNSESSNINGSVRLNSDRIALGYKPKYYYNEKTYFFGIFDWEQDKPGNIESATRQIAGIGHRFYSSPTGYLSAEADFGNKTTDLLSGGDVNGGIGYLGLNFLSRVNENVTFNADMRSDFGSDNTFVEIGLGAAFKVSEKPAFKIAHFSRSNSDLSSGDSPLSSSSDSVTSVNLVIDI